MLANIYKPVILLQQRHAPLRRPEPAARQRTQHVVEQRAARARGRVRTRASASASPFALATLDSVYALLGLQPGSEYAEVRAAYRRLAAASHPDVDPSPTASNKFKAINLALEVLTDDGSRRACAEGGVGALGPKYSFLREYLVGHGFAGSPGYGRGPGGAPRRRERGGDVYTVAGLEFGQAVTGVERPLSLTAFGFCPDCQGSGDDTAASAGACPVCSGTGSIMRREWGSGSSPRPMAPSRCPACYGAGRSATRGCGRCRGEGRVRMLRSVRVRVPAGVADGQILRIKGQGDAGRLGGEAGDLFVKLQVYDLSAAGIERVGDDLHSTLSVGLIDALLGGEVPVATVRGRATISVPPGTQHGAALRLDNAGVVSSTRRGVMYGHHYFTVALRLPHADELTPEAVALLQQLGRLRRAAGGGGGEGGGEDSVGGGSARGGEWGPGPPPPRVRARAPPRQESGRMGAGGGGWKSSWSWRAAAAPGAASPSTSFDGADADSAAEEFDGDWDHGDGAEDGGSGASDAGVQRGPFASGAQPGRRDRRGARPPHM